MGGRGQQQPGAPRTLLSGTILCAPAVPMAAVLLSAPTYALQWLASQGPSARPAQGGGREVWGMMRMMGASSTSSISSLATCNLTVNNMIFNVFCIFITFV